jgi:hypothetical protein
MDSVPFWLLYPWMKRTGREATVTDVVLLAEYALGVVPDTAEKDTTLLPNVHVIPPVGPVGPTLPIEPTGPTAPADP